ncbi:MAG: TIGR02099 family protein [Pseudomonadota bacterium]|nr:TIGR02099 family protein [Pseudomonadota bacterium]
MERVKRRWWTWVVSLIAVTVIVGAVLSGAFQLAVLAVPSYREDLAAWVSRVAGRPVQIGGISLSWRGLAPRFDLSGITLYSEEGDPQLRIERVSLGLGLRRLIVGEWVPTRLELSGMRLLAEIDEEGNISIAGFDPMDASLQDSQRAKWLEDLNRFEEVRLENCELRVVGIVPGSDAPLSLRIEAIDLDQSADSFAVGASLRLPAERGGELRFESELDGQLANVASWNGSFEIDVYELQPQSWLRPWLIPGAQISVAGLTGHITGDVVNGALTHAKAELESEALVLARAGVLSSAAQMRMVADYQTDARGWRIDVSELAFDDQPLFTGNLRRDAQNYNFDADHVELTRLAPWTGVWRSGGVAMQTLGRLAGDVRGVVLRYQPDAGHPRYSLRARLDGAALRADKHVGFAGLSGELSADETGGELRVAKAPANVQLPSTFDHPLALDELGATLRWKRMVDGWQLSSEDAALRLAGISARGSFSIDLADVADTSPHLDLSATLSAQRLDDARPFLPLQWPDSLKNWLRTAVISGRVPNADLRIRGPIADFPFHSRPTGEWGLEMDVADGVLAFAPDWPQLNDVRAHLAFSGNSLTVRSDQALIGGNKVSSAEVRFADFNDHLMSIEGAARGELKRFYQFLRESPLQRTLSGLLDHTEASGAAEVLLQLQVPLNDMHKTSVIGSVTTRDAKLRYTSLDEPITALSGSIGFTEHGVSAEALTALFAGVPVTARIDADDGSRGVIRGEFDYAPEVDGSGLSKFVPEFVRGRLQGSSRWQMELPLIESGMALTLKSDLIGLAVNFPAPLFKAAARAAPASLRIGADTLADLRVDLDYDLRLALAVLMVKGDGALRLSGMRATAGGSGRIDAKPGSFLLDGHVAALELSAWSPLFVGVGEAGAVRLDAADLDVGQLHWNGLSVPSTHLQYRPLADGWRIDVTGTGAEGQVRWTPADNGHLVARMQRMNLQRWPELPATGTGDTVVSAVETAMSAEPVSKAVVEPATLPLIDLDVDQLNFGDTDYGRVEMQTERVPGGLALRTLQFSGGELALQASGAWRRIGGLSSGELNFDMDSARFGTLLEHLGYAPNIEARHSVFKGALAWSPAATGLQWEQASGQIDLDIREGQLRAVDPGASRVLGLFNFYALPRRLTLDFDDVTGKGLAFDTIKGHFEVANGDAITQGLKIESPSLRMDISGKVGLATRDYDQRVTVYPDLSSGVTLGAVLLGGPAVGALVLLAQQLFDKPFDQVTQFSYSITGPWDNPRIERGEATPVVKTPG